MTPHVKDILEECAKILVAQMIEDGHDFMVIIPPFDDWEFPLPEKILKGNGLPISISGWTKEESYVDKDGLFIKTAFGEDENSKLVPFWQIGAIVDEKQNTIFTKPYPLQDPTPAPMIATGEKHSMKSVMTMPSEDDAGVRDSMNAFRKNNKGLK